MAEKQELLKQYGYKENSNLVLQSKGRRDAGPTGEVESLSGSATSLQREMGSLAQRARPKELEERLKKKKSKMLEREALLKKQSRQPQSVLDTDVVGGYRPQTTETRAAYAVLLTFVQDELPGKPDEVLHDAANEVLSIMKNENLRDNDRKKEVELLFRRREPLADNRFSQLYNTITKITDYTAEGDEGMEIDDDLGVNVVFDDDGASEEDDYDMDEIPADEDDEDQDLGDETDLTMRIASNLGDSAMEVEEDREGEVDAREVDAFWLQRQVNTFLKDAHKSRELSEEILSILANTDDDERRVENKLVTKVGFDRFDFVKKLLQNRLKIVYCTRLARAADDNQRAAIEEEMSNSLVLRLVLEDLKRTTSTQEQSGLLHKKLLSNNSGKKKGAAGKGEAGADGAAGGALSSNIAMRPRNVIDLESLVFDAEGHTMTNTEVKLPGSEIIKKKDYQEVHIPAKKAKPLGEDERLVPISDLPQWMHPAFKNMTSLNRVQSKIYETALYSAENLLLCAPTGAGKTNCAMLTIMREIGLNRNDDGSFNLDNFKIVYVAPMKSLVQEMVLNFGNRLKPFGINVRELSGDQQLSKQQIADTQLIVTTPEKWDIITRKSGDRTYTQLVKLLIIDEIHLLHDSRGPVIESTVARTIRQVEATQELVRIVGLSATLPNYEDVSMFLRVKPDKGLFFFDNSFRPCPLQQQFIGVTKKKAFKRMEIMNEITYEKVMDHAGKDQVIVFVHSRKETATTARSIRDMAVENDELAKFVAEETGRRELLTTEAEENVKNEELKELLPFGLAIHHAGLTKSDRNLVEELFAAGHVQVLVSTATLAWGVNLPAHCVIIKGTQVYNPEKGAWTELSPQDVMQMLGRAGRPQYDTHGEGIVITTHAELQYYLSLMNAQLPIESQLMKQLVDNLNAECVLGSVQNIKEGVTWLGYTYLYVRMLSRPSLYGVSATELENDPTLEQRRYDLIHSAALILDKHNLIQYDRKSGNLQVTDLGRVASHYYVSYTSMSAFNEYLKPTMSDIEIFRVFSLSSEFKNMSVRENEKIELAKLLDKVPIPVKESMDEPSAKVNVLLQAYISRLKLDGFALLSDMVYITQSAGRVMRALFEITLKRGWASVAEKVLNLCKMIDHRMWGAQSPLRQFSRIPGEIVKRIESKDFPWERLYDLEAHAIGELVRYPRMGVPLHKAIRQLPRLQLEGHIQPITKSVLRVELTVTPDFAFTESVHGHAEPFWILVEDADSEKILHHEYFVLKSIYSEEEHPITFTIPIQEPMPPQYFVRILSDRWLGSETVLPISFRHLLLPERFAPPTELLDLAPLPVTELAAERFIEFFSGRFDMFNPIQTQVFSAAYKADNNLLVCAPTGSGKTTIAELTIFRMIQNDRSGRCVYVAPTEAIARERYADWSQSFPKVFGMSVTKLTGEATVDNRLLAQSQITIATAEQWDVMSRRWMTRKSVQGVSLVIMDEVHLIGGPKGPVMEVVMSRMRYMASRLEKPLRIVALGASMANAMDVAGWIGCTNSSAFNFHPSVRPVPLEMRIQGFDINSYNARQLAMSKPCFTTIKTLSPNKPVIAFTSSRKHARRLALDLMTACASEGTPTRFLHADVKDVEPHLEKVTNRVLRETLRCGIAFYHEGLSALDRRLVEELFKSGAIQVIVSEVSLCWGMSLTAHLVVIVGTQNFDGREHRYVDYPITDMIQMLGRASRPGLDQVGRCSIFCHTPKKEFYKKFLYEPFPVESHLDHHLADHMSAEIVNKRIENLQDAVDYLTWTFFYRRLPQNPNYYNMQGTTHRHVSDHLSELVETTLNDLEESQCVALEEDNEVSALNLGMIAAYYYIRYQTLELYSSLLTHKTKVKGLLDILSNSSEFETISVRSREDIALRKLAMHLPLKIENAGSYSDPHVKTNVLLQAHFSRIALSGAVAEDQATILPQAVRLLQAMVDVLSSKGWLKPAISCMELSQMITQGLWSTDSGLMQLPFVTKAMAAQWEKAGLENVLDILDLEDEDRDRLISSAKFSKSQLRDFTHYCNNFPNIEVNFEVEDADEVEAGSACTIVVELERDPDDEEDEEDAENYKGVPTVVSTTYPVPKSEGWWLVVGDEKKNKIYHVKRVSMKAKKTQVKLNMTAPSMGHHDLTLYLVSDSYLGIDQVIDLPLDVKEGSESSSEEESDE